MKKLLATAISVLLLVTLTGCFGGGDDQVKDTQTSTLYTLKIEGASFETISMFKKDLEELKSVKKIYQKDFVKGETSELQVDYMGTTQILADQIREIDNDDYFIEILGFNPSSVDLKLGAE